MLLVAPGLHWRQVMLFGNLGALSGVNFITLRYSGGHTSITSRPPSFSWKSGFQIWVHMRITWGAFTLREWGKDRHQVSRALQVNLVAARSEKPCTPHTNTIHLSIYTVALGTPWGGSTGPRGNKLRGRRSFPIVLGDSRLEHHLFPASPDSRPALQISDSSAGESFS